MITDCLLLAHLAMWCDLDNVAPHHEHWCTYDDLDIEAIIRSHEVLYTLGWDAVSIYYKDSLRGIKIVVEMR